MPNNHDDITNYQHIKTLVRDLHTIKNVARPEQLANITNAKNVHQMHSMTSTPSVSLPQKLTVHQFKSLPSACTVLLDDTFIEEEDEASDTNTSSMDVPLTTAAHPTHHQRIKENGNDVNFSIPSVVVTDINEPLDLITSTQRRFSQLYSGLRRLSTSNTVGLATI